MSCGFSKGFDSGDTFVLYSTYTGKCRVKALRAGAHQIELGTTFNLGGKSFQITNIDIKDHSDLDPKRQYQPAELAKRGSAKINLSDNRRAYILMLLSYKYIMILQKETAELKETEELLGQLPIDDARSLYPGSDFEAFVTGRLPLAQYQQYHRQFSNFNAGVDILYYTQMYLQFLYEHLGVLGVNDCEHYVAIFNVPDLDNAFYSPTGFMIYGTGDRMFKNLASPDTVAHELSHGLTKHTNNLVYQGESGALNEHASDVFAKVFEDYLYLQGGDEVRGCTDWEIGEDVAVDFKRKRLRDMEHPERGMQPQPSSFQGKHWVDPRNLAFDHGGVHVNSGVGNRLFRIVTAHYDEDTFRALKLFYRCYRQLNPRSDFKHFASLLVKEDPSVRQCLKEVNLGLQRPRWPAHPRWGFPPRWRRGYPPRWRPY